MSEQCSHTVVVILTPSLVCAAPNRNSVLVECEKVLSFSSKPKHRSVQSIQMFMIILYYFICDVFIPIFYWFTMWVGHLSYIGTQKKNDVRACYVWILYSHTVHITGDVSHAWSSCGMKFYRIHEFFIHPNKVSRQEREKNGKCAGTVIGGRKNLGKKGIFGKKNSKIAFRYYRRSPHNNEQWIWKHFHLFMRPNVPYNKIIHAQFFHLFFPLEIYFHWCECDFGFSSFHPLPHLRFDDFWIKSNLFRNENKCRVSRGTDGTMAACWNIRDCHCIIFLVLCNRLEQQQQR